jgi:2',3'-cyclic-nucleotide 2'-phosphodiesterase (5'-nucleotidase family)
MAPLIPLVLACTPGPPVASLAAGGTAGSPGVRSELATDGKLRDRLADADDADLVLLYGGEEVGSLETCGCQNRPRGSLARVLGYRMAMEKAQPGVPSVLVDAGNWLDATVGEDEGQLRNDVVVADRFMVEGMHAAGYAAGNVGFRDLPYLASAGFPDLAVSANVRPRDPSAAGPALYRTVEAGTHKVAITGVSDEEIAYLQPAGFEYRDPLASLREVVPRMASEADVVVVLAYGVGPAARSIAELPGVDVLIEADDYRELYSPFVQGEAVWVRSHLQTMRLGELRLVLRDGRVAGALDRKIDLDEEIPSAPRVLQIAISAREAIDDEQERLFGTW